MSNAVLCPPYPTRATTPAKQHKMLLELYNWWCSQLPEARAHIQDLREDVCARLFSDISRESLLRVFSQSSVKIEPNFSRYLNVSVESMNMTHDTMKAVRERYDDLLRNYEEAWDSQAAVYVRLQLLRAIQFMLSVAFLSSEQVEAREDAVARREHANYVKNLREAVQDLEAHLRILSNGESKAGSDSVPDDWYSAPEDSAEGN